MNTTKQLDEIVDGFVKEVTGDYVGLWQIASEVRNRLGIRGDREVKEKVLLIVRRLLEHGLRPGDYVHPAFKFWKEHDADSILARIGKEWDLKHGDPDFSNCWFDALPGSKAYADHRMRHP